jgi:hypothetical protein
LDRGIGVSKFSCPHSLVTDAGNQVGNASALGRRRIQSEGGSDRGIWTEE